MMTILLFGILNACNSTNVKSKDDSKCYLISTSHKFLVEGVSDEGLLFRKNRDIYIKPYLSSEYRGDTLIVKTIQEIDPCAGVKGTIEIKNDTIHLLTKNSKDILCNTFELHEFTYKIKVDKKYVIRW